MNQDQNTPDVNRASGAAAGFLIASLIFIVLVVVVKLAVNVPSIDAARADLISQTLYQMRTNEVASLSSPGWIDHDRGIVRLPIDRAMQIAAQEWQDPAQARADLISRAQRAAAPAPKVAPKANPFE
ncbi:MAG TPA: hypothetical protein VK811_02615 [Candidatus Acidoferrum sp.]|nr:hypothetical protein [Candidatus Acidoferrum sp.]